MPEPYKGSDGDTEEQEKLNPVDYLVRLVQVDGLVLKQDNIDKGHVYAAGDYPTAYSQLADEFPHADTSHYVLFQKNDHTISITKNDSMTPTSRMSIRCSHAPASATGMPNANPDVM